MHAAEALAFQAAQWGHSALGTRLRRRLHLDTDVAFEMEMVCTRLQAVPEGREGLSRGPEKTAPHREESGPRWAEDTSSDATGRDRDTWHRYGWLYV